MTAGFFDLYQAPLITGGEKELLHAHLQISRDVLLWKLEGLSEADQRRPMTGTGTNLLGIVKHLTGVEGAYFCDAFGRERPPLAWETDEDSRLGEFSDMYAKPGETAAEIIASYRAATAAEPTWYAFLRSRQLAPGSRTVQTHSGIVKDLDKTLVGWCEVSEAPLPAGGISQHWFDTCPSAAAAAKGMGVVLSPAKHAYLDQKYSKDTPIGHDWAGYVSVQQAYDWPQTLSGVPDAQILGVDSALWTEFE